MKALLLPLYAAVPAGLSPCVAFAVPVILHFLLSKYRCHCIYKDLIST